MCIKHKQVKENCVQKLVKDQIQDCFPKLLSIMFVHIMRRSLMT